jgi:hypothetical protein
VDVYEFTYTTPPHEIDENDHLWWSLIFY